MANNIQIMTLNVGGPGYAQEKRDYIENSFQTQLRQCSVIFVQECNGRDRTNLMGILGRRDYQISPGNGNIRDVAIIWQPNVFRQVEYFDDVKKFINGDELFQEMTNRNYDINDRVKVIRATLRPTGRVVYFASWHGPHNRVTNEHKADTARDLIRLMRNISGIQPFIVGGDFNLRAHNQFPAVKNRVVVHHSYRPRQIIPNIDYFVLGNRQEFRIQGVARPLPLQDREILDHEPVQACFVRN
uniref:Endonuclease/exonuclease/phosphatase domain-containing protein n=1 Tax=Clytia hemisphaerica TaxID=252671 RepID=A0A7M5XMY9_9CNID